MSESYDFTEQIGHLLRRAYQRHVAIFQQMIPDSELTSSQFVALCAVNDLEACSLNDVVQRTAIDQATIRGVVSRLSAKGLIKVAPDKQDGRKHSITMTDDGKRVLAQMIPIAQQISDRTFGHLNAAERLALVHTLKQIRDLND